MIESPSHWHPLKLGEVAEFKYGKALPASARDGDTYPVFGSNGIVGQHSTWLSPAPTIVIGRKGSVGEVCFSEKNCSPIDTTYYMDSFDFFDPKFCFYLLKNLRLGELNKSTAIPGLNRQDAYELKISLPSIYEQTRIAQKLDELLAQVDTLKARIDAIPALLKRFRQSVLTAAVSGQLTVQRESTDLPDDWQRVKFSSVINDLRYGTAQKCDYNGGVTGVLRIPNISEKGINTNNLKYANFNAGEIKKLSLQRGDIVLIRSNGSVSLVGRSAVIGTNEEGLLFAGYLIRVRLNIEYAIPEYVNYWLKSPAVRQAIELTARSTSGVNNINSEEIKSLTFTMPSLAEQTEIVRRVEQLFAFADQLEAKVASAKSRIDHLTQSILAKAFRGELVPQDPNDEPASVLLERIKAQRAAAPKAKRGRKASV
ncbi:restriction endonuclease subunit S [Pseudomonas sp. PDM31]|uniref:restriction endonuclease subunit S n=1 Tax=Pseudomonas sp. PDM31 TaxID=2854778 RepID=UPI001C465EFC|nr:restriction endonuclease subunit S [Pseudomonas sp. PDM31]MBV7477176.1 restriction endonuclease subunit S [Pseudomonas sp. PDM31]